MCKLMATPRAEVFHLIVMHLVAYSPRTAAKRAVVLVDQ